MLYSRMLLDSVQFALAIWGIYEWSKPNRIESGEEACDIRMEK